MPRTTILLMFLTMLALPTHLMAQVAGQVVGLKPSAQIVTAAGSATLAEGSPVSSGDTIRTGPSGQVQILFADETKIVVGPNSVLRIDATLFRANGTARKFTTAALGGSFRFISGKSPKRVYKISTPVATMGIRGTAFDFTVAGRSGTDLLVFDGLVQFCSEGRRCAQVPGGCQAVSIGVERNFSQPETAAEKQALLLARFPLLAAQQGLRPPFRADTAGCDAVDVIALPGVARESEREGSDRGPSEGPGQSPGGGGGGNPADGPGGSPGDGGNPAE